MTQFAVAAFESLLTARQKAELLAGTTLGHWKLSSVLSSGGFSVVYKAAHPQLGAGAVKVLAFDSNQHAAISTLFQREIRILKALTDEPGVQFVPRIYDAEIRKKDGLAWIAMQHVDGQTLEDWLKTRAKEPLELSELRGILGAVLTALAAVEDACRARTSRNSRAKVSSQCIVHGDIKPSNILVHSRGDQRVAWLLDFGIARIYEPLGQSMPSPTAVPTIGKRPLTMLYASPEMLAPRPALDQRSDVFQVGLLGYEMMTRHRYWDRWPQTEADLKRCKYPAWLKEILRTALDWNRDRRYADAHSFLRAIERS